MLQTVKRIEGRRVQSGRSCPLPPMQTALDHCICI